jgi:hypothetical protein
MDPGTLAGLAFARRIWRDFGAIAINSVRPPETRARRARGECAPDSAAAKLPLLGVSVGTSATFF